MTNGGDAAEQVVRLSLEGFEVAAKLTGSAAKNIALLLVSVLKQEQKTKGKARLTSMIRSGKELKVFSIQNRDLSKFTEQAKKYGVLYCVLRDKDNKNATAPVDIIVRAEDASKIQRIVDRFELAKVDKTDVVTEVVKDAAEHDAIDKGTEQTKSKGEALVDELLGKPAQKEENALENPTAAKTGAEKPPLRQNSETDGSYRKKDVGAESEKPSVREKLNNYKKQSEEKNTDKIKKSVDKQKSANKNKQTVHRQPYKKKKRKDKGHR